VLSAELSTGRLQITGYATRSALVTIQGTAFKTTANPGRTFDFNLAYRTANCVVVLVTSTGSVAAPISNCTAGLSARGAWSASTPYQPGDLALFQGTTWVALLDNQGKQPNLYSASTRSSRAAAAAVAYWAAFAPGGDQGPRGPAGATGAAGLQGPTGIKGVTGLQGPPGPKGPAGDPGADNNVAGQPGAPGIFADAHIETSACADSESYNFVGDTSYYCIAACPLGEASMAGWEIILSEGGSASVVDPILVDENAEYAANYADREAVVTQIPNVDVNGTYVRVAIACLPGTVSPLAPPS
jgi:hypothetical protein